MSQRFFIGNDDSGHDYLVPVENRAEWFAFLEIPSDDERSWDVPAFAIGFDSAMLTFTDPEFE